MTRKNRWRLAIYGGLAFAVLGLCLYLFWMPGPATPPAARAPLPAPAQESLEAEILRDVESLGGERNMLHPAAYLAALQYLESEVKRAGYTPQRQTYAIESERDGVNLEAERKGNAEIVVVGAHYDSVAGSPGANDNGSGTAAVLALARRFANRSCKRTVRFVWFANEEPPYFQTEDMGSVHYAKRCRARNENVVAMLSLETLGYFTDEADSQTYPHAALKALYPDTGNFVAFVGNVGSASLVRQAIGVFRAHATIPSSGTAMFDVLPGVGWSDHWSFWQEGYAAIMITDTAPFRYPYYHTDEDTPDKLSYDKLAHAVIGLTAVLDALANE